MQSKTNSLKQQVVLGDCIASSSNPPERRNISNSEWNHKLKGVQHSVVIEKQHVVVHWSIMTFPCIPEDDTIDAKYPGEDSILSLYDAIQDGDLHMTKVILLANSPGLRCQNWEASINLAARQNSWFIMDCIIDHCKKFQINMNEIYYKGDNCLHVAVRHGCNEVVESLLTSKAVDVCLLNKEGNHVLNIAARQRNLQIIRLLEGYMTPGDIQQLRGINNVESPFHHIVPPYDIPEAEQQDTVLISKILKGMGFNINQLNCAGFTPLHLSLVLGCCWLSKALIEDGADVAYASPAARCQPMHIAARFGHSEIIKLLISRNADINCRNLYQLTPLHLAAREGHTPCVATLLAAQAAVNCVDENGYTPLHFAAQEQHADIVDILAPKGANLDLQNAKWETPLHLALHYAKGGVYQQQLAVVRTLLEHGAGVNVVDAEENTPLHLADSNADGWDTIVKKMVEYGADVYKVNGEGVSVFQVAIMCENLEVIKYLREKAVEGCADVNFNSCLHLAAQLACRSCYKTVVQKNLEVVQALLNFGAADVDAVNSHKENVMHFLLNSDAKCSFKLDQSVDMTHIGARIDPHGSDVDSVFSDSTD